MSDEIYSEMYDSPLLFFHTPISNARMKAIIQHLSLIPQLASGAHIHLTISTLFLNIDHRNRQEESYVV